MLSKLVRGSLVLYAVLALSSPAVVRADDDLPPGCVLSPNKKCIMCGEGGCNIKFNELATHFFETTTWKSDTNWVAAAHIAGIDTVGFDTCIRSPSTTERIRTDKLSGTKLGITATPSFVVKQGVHLGLQTDSVLIALAQHAR